MCTAALAKAAAISVPETVCVCDDGGYPIALERMDRLHSIFTNE